jgi:hypothetical protein
MDPDDPEKKERQNQSVKTVQAGGPPPCLELGEGLCRGCPGWRVMTKAAQDDDGLWSQYPIHCGATGRTVYPEPGGKKE